MNEIIFEDDWKEVDGSWALTNHAMMRLSCRFELSKRDIYEMLENLNREIVVRVPNKYEEGNVYTVQTLVNGKTVNLIVEKKTKRIITAKTPFLFSGQLSDDRLTEQRYDVTWSPEGLTTEILKDEIAKNEDKVSEDQTEVEVLRKSLDLANKRIIELERAIKSIKSYNSVLMENALKVKDSCNAIL